MYIPAAFRETDTSRLHDFLRENSFGMLVSVAGDGVPFATHLPFVFDPGVGAQGTLFAHVARANPQWRTWEDAGMIAPEALVIFAGPHTYVSPRWYADPAASSVPTWNYAAVHAYGVPRLQTPSELRLILANLAAQYEPEDGWRMEAQSEEYLDRMVRGIVGIAIPVTRLEGKWKMSQNQSVANQSGVIAALRESSTGPGDPASLTANIMASLLADDSATGSAPAAQGTA